MKLLLSFTFSLLFIFSFAQKKENNQGWSTQPFSRKVFIENKSQFNYNAVYPRDFDYVIDMGTKVFFKNNQLTFIIRDNHIDEWKEEEREHALSGKFVSKEEEEREREKFKPTFTTVSLTWLNANENARVIVQNEDRTEYLFPNHEVKGRGFAKSIRCKGYKKLIIKELYPGVDAHYSFTERNGGFKYALHVSPNADVSKIKFQYSGDIKKVLKSSTGKLIVNTYDGNIEEDAPFSYDKSTKTEIPSSFKVNENYIISFDVENTSNGIVIDPWSRVPNYTPSTAVDIGRDGQGNVYATSGDYILEKYDVNGNIQFSIPVDTNGSFGDMLTNEDGFCFFNTAGLGSSKGHHAITVDSNGNRFWISTGINECWRFVQNECIGEVYSLVGVNHSNSGFAIIDATTGAVSGYTESDYGQCCEDPHCGAIDNNGDVYTIASTFTAPIETNIYKWDQNNNLVATYPFNAGSFGYDAGYAGAGAFVQGYNGMQLSGDILYIHDGEFLFLVDKNTGNTVNQMNIPAGAANGCGGLWTNFLGLYQWYLYV